MANTPAGLPYPLPSAPVASGAADIRALAEALDLTVKQPACRLRFSVEAPIPNATYTQMVWDIEDLDNDNMHDPTVGVPRTKITFTHAGIYAVGAQWRWRGNANGARQGIIQHNGTANIAFDDWNALDFQAQYEIWTKLHTVAAFAAGDFVQFLAYQSSGGSLNVPIASPYMPIAYAYRIGA